MIMIIITVIMRIIPPQDTYECFCGNQVPYVEQEAYVEQQDPPSEPVETNRDNVEHQEDLEQQDPPSEPVEPNDDNVQHVDYYSQSVVEGA